VNIFSFIPKYFLKELLLFYIISLIFAILLFGFSYSSLLFLIVQLIIFIFIARINRVSQKKTEQQVIKVIKSIQSSEISKEEEIILEPYLSELEAQIKAMYSKMKEDIEYLKKLERMRSEFLANVSHELRTPIFAIQGYIETLLNGAINDSKVNLYFLEKANNHTINLNNLLNDLIDISMIETGEMRLSFRYFAIAEYLKDIVQEFFPLAESKNLKLILHPIRKGLKLYADREKLKQVMSNLIQNAIKYTETGTIEISVEEEDKYSKISVSDSGIGIPEDDIDRIFERFYRVDKARSRDVGGTGLGLAIAKHIIEAHNSKIEVRSQLNKGTEFFFRLKK